MSVYEELLNKTKEIADIIKEAEIAYEEILDKTALANDQKEKCLLELQDAIASTKDYRDSNSELMKDINSRIAGANATKAEADRQIKLNAEEAIALGKQKEDLEANYKAYVDALSEFTRNKAEWNKSNRELQVLEGRKSSLLGEIKGLEDIIKGLNESIDEIMAKNEAKEREINLIKSELVAKISSNDVLTSKLNQKLEELDKKEQELAIKSEDLMIRKAQADRSQEEANEKLVEASKQLDIINAKNEELVSRETILVEKENKLAEREQATNSKESVAQELWHGAKELESSLLTKQEVLNIKIAQNDKRDADLVIKEAEVNSQKADQEKKAEELQYLEIRLNKIIKEKNIAELLNAN